MAFKDDARAFAEQATRSIEQGIEQVRERIDELGRQRRFNDLARQLGLLTYRARRAGTQPDQAEVERLSNEMASVEATLGAAGGSGEQPGGTGPGSPGGAGEQPGGTGGPPAQQGHTLDDL